MQSLSVFIPYLKSSFFVFNANSDSDFVITCMITDRIGLIKRTKLQAKGGNMLDSVPPAELVISTPPPCLCGQRRKENSPGILHRPARFYDSTTCFSSLLSLKHCLPSLSILRSKEIIFCVMNESNTKFTSKFAQVG